MRLSRRYVFRLVCVNVVLLVSLACGGTTCSCLTPLEAPVAEDARIYDAVQARLTPDAFGFIENNLTDIIGTFMQDGLTFDVPPTDASQEFGWCPLCITIDIHLCDNGCTLTAEVVDAAMTRVAPDTLALDATVNLSGTITIDGDLDCDIPIDVRGKHVLANILFYTDIIDHLLSFKVNDVSLSIDGNDYEIICDWGILSDIGLGDWINDGINWIAGLLTSLLNNQLNSQVNDALDQAISDATCLPCDYYTGGCPSGSTCDSGFCKQGGNCRLVPLGMAGSIDLAAQLGGLGGAGGEPLDVFVAAGQERDPVLDPLIVDDGLELRMIGAVDTTRDDCVPQPDPLEIPSNASPPRLTFTPTVPVSGETYMAGIGVSDAFLDWFIYKAYLSGVLCLSIGTETTDLLTSSTISIMGLASLNDLTGGRNVPVKLKLKPGHVPYMEVGAGTFTTDADNNKVIDEPLLFVFMPGTALDFYVLLDEHWTRILTFTIDLSLDLGLDMDQNNKITPIFGEDSIHLDNVTASNYELLEEDPQALEELIPTLISMALPMLTGAMAPIEIPPIEGFALDIKGIKGVMPRAGTDYYEYLGLYANLSMASNPPTPGRDTRARIAEVDVPRIDQMSIYRPGGPLYPEVSIRVSTASGEPAEYSFSLDGGFWSPFGRGPVLRLRDPRLLLAGEHLIDVRARTPGNYRSLDATPVRLSVDIQPRPVRCPRVQRPSNEIQPGDMHLADQLRKDFAGLRAENELVRPAEQTSAGGCACSSSRVPSVGWLLLLALGIALRKRAPNKSRVSRRFRL